MIGLVEIDELFGLPAHPLVVHAAVVLIPLAAFATIACAAVPRWRRSYAPLALAVALAATAAVGVSQGSGEALEERVEETELVEEHAGMGERVLPWAAVVTVVAAGIVALPTIERRRPTLSGRTVTAVVVAAAVIGGAGATITVTQVGHSGAKAAWEDVDEEGGGGADAGDEDEDRDDDRQEDRDDPYGD